MGEELPVVNKMIFAARIVLGVFYLLSGLNWFFGFMPALPSIHMAPDLPIKHAVVAEMIRTGWMFQSAKIVEVAFGLSLLTNRLVPLMLLAALPVAFLTFMLDAMILGDLWHWIIGMETTAAMWAAVEDMIIGGLCVLLIHLWLIWCYFDYYRPLVVWEATPDAGQRLGTGAPASPWLRRVFFAFGWLGLALQAYNLFLFAELIGFVPPPEAASAHAPEPSKYPPNLHPSDRP